MTLGLKGGIRDRKFNTNKKNFLKPLNIFCQIYLLSCALSFYLDFWNAKFLPLSSENGTELLDQLNISNVMCEYDNYKHFCSAFLKIQSDQTENLLFCQEQLSCLPSITIKKYKLVIIGFCTCILTLFINPLIYSLEN